MINRGIVLLRRGENGEAALAQFDEVIWKQDDRARRGPPEPRRGALVQMLRRHGAAIAEITQALSLGVAEPHKAYYQPRRRPRGPGRSARAPTRIIRTALEIQPDWGPANAELGPLRPQPPGSPSPAVLGEEAAAIKAARRRFGDAFGADSAPILSGPPTRSRKGDRHWPIRARRRARTSAAELDWDAASGPSWATPVKGADDGELFVEDSRHRELLLG